MKKVPKKKNIIEKIKELFMKNKGFTLIEILATLIVISLVFGISGYYVTNILSTSKEKTQDIAFKSIQKSANMYVQEYEEEIVWNKENNGNSTACISIDDLIATGYLKENQVENLENMSYMLITKKNNSIIKEENDTNGKCGNVKKKIAIPTSKICTNPEYNTKTQTIVETNQTGYTLENTTGTNAGEYKVTAKLAPNYIWKDNTTENKIITCTIKKAIPIISFSQNGQDTPKVGEKTPFTVTTNIPGKITAKSSDLNHIKPTIENPEITETGTIKIECLSSKELPTYITVTLTPNDTNNYFTVSKSYTVGKVERKETDKPTTNYCIPSLLYNGSNRKLTSAPGTGYTFLNNKGTDAGDYKVIAQLKYGYIWTDGTTTDATITCSIKQAPTTITINSVEGDLKNDNNVFSGNTTRGTIMKEHEITLNFTSSVPGDIEITPTSNNFINISTPEKINDKTYKVKIKAKSVTDSAIIVTIKNSPKDSNNYEQAEKKYIIEKIIDNEFKIDYNCNGGGSGPARQTVKYNTQYTITSSTCTRQGYTQNQWLDLINNKWTAGKTGTWKLVNGNNGIQNNILTLIADWQAGTYSIKYNLNNGTSGTKAPTSAKVDEVVQIDNPTKTVTITGNANGTGVTVGNPTKITQTFNGWTATGLGANAKRGDKSNNVNTTWNGSNETKSIYFINLRSTSGTATLIANWQPTQASVPTFTKIPTGKKCSWNTKADGTGTTYDTKDKYNLASDSEKDITLYAICINNIAITLNKNGGTGGNNSLEVELNKTQLNPSTITLPTKQITVSYNMNGTGISQVSDSKVNQSLNGWYSAQTNGEQIINNSPTPQLQASTAYTNSKKEWTKNAATTLYAHWNSGELTLPNLSKEGHECQWAEGSTSGSKYDAGVKRSLSSNKTYYAICNKKTYTITYNLNSTGATSSKRSENITYGATTTLATVTRNGFVCSWNTESNGGGTSYASGRTGFSTNRNITLYAKCTRNFNCAEKGGTTTYAGKSWTTINKTDDYCELAANFQSNVIGSYTDARTNLTTSFFTTSGADYNSTMKNEMDAGLLIKPNNNYNSYIDSAAGTTGTMPTGIYWVASKKIYDSYDRNKYSASSCTNISIVQGYSYQDKLSVLTGCYIEDGTNLEPRPRPSGYSHGAKDMTSNNSTKYTYQDGRDIKSSPVYGSTYFTKIESNDGRSANQHYDAYYCQYDFAISYDSRCKGSQVKITNFSDKAKNYIIYVCGGKYSDGGKDGTATMKPEQVGGYAGTVVYFSQTGTNDAHHNPDDANGGGSTGPYYFAGKWTEKQSADGKDVIGNPYNPSNNPSCVAYRRHTVANLELNLHYRARIKVKMK